MSNRPLLVAVEKCQLCGRTRKQFSCQACVSSGNFVASSFNSEGGTSFANKLKKLKIVVAVRNEYHHRVVHLLENQKTKKKKQTSKVLLAEKIKILHLILREKKHEHEREKNSNEELLHRISQRKELINRMITKTETLKNDSRLQEKREKLQQYKQKLLEKNDQLRQLRIDHVQALVTDIFPLSERDVSPAFGTPPRNTVTTDDYSGDVISETLSTTEMELEEATLTVHVGGRWISQNSVQTKCTIVDVGMPTSSDFVKYFEWLKSYRNEPRNSESQSSLHDKSILSIPASLLYTAQLTDGLSFFLGVNLPYKMEYPNFGLLQVSRQRLFQSINKLSDNIMYLCYSQLIPTSKLDANKLLNNIQLCLSTENSNLGWCGPFHTFEYEVMECAFDSDSSGEELNYDSDSASVVGEPEDWDQLMDLPPDHRGIQSETPCHSLEQSRDRSLSSSASGLMTSAAASVASALWSWKR